MERFNSEAQNIRNQSSILQVNQRIKTSPFTEHQEKVDIFTDPFKLTMSNLAKNAKLMHVFKQSVRKFKGTNEPVNFKKQYGFSERWEEAIKMNFQRNQNALLNANFTCLFIAIMVMFHKIPFIWILSIQSIFEIENNPAWNITGAIIITIDILLQTYLIFQQFSKNSDKTKSNNLQIFSRISMLIIGDIATLLIILFQIFLSRCWPYKIMLDLIAVFFQSHRFYEIYKSINIILVTYKYKNYANLFAFISKMLIIIHFFAIVIYSATFMRPQQNWLQSLGKDISEPFQKYIYSLYFIATTMFTVGYGDITPKNTVQIGMVILIQLSGIILNGYIVNQIGHTLTSIRQKQQQFQHDIQNTNQICQYYQLGKDLSSRVRNYIVNHQLVNQELNIEEQNRFMMKLNQELRNQVKNVNQLKIVKTSLFLLCNWSKKMQNQLAKKLQKFIFSPNQRIINKDKLFIVTKGKIDVYIEKKVGSKVYLKKHLKTIQREASQQVFSNVYGQTSLFTAKPNKLSAVSKNFAICYALDYGDILDIIKDDQRDFQYYHETKTNLQLSKFPQKYEFPSLINNRQHYCPTRSIVLQKYRKQLLGKQQRQISRRTNLKKQRLVLQEKQKKVHFGSSESDMQSCDDESVLQMKFGQNNDQPRDRTSHRRKAIFNLSFISDKKIRNQLHNRPSFQNNLKQQQIKKMLSDQIVLTSYFEVGKNYQKYFKKGNRQAVLSRLNKHEIKKFPLINSKIMSMEWLDLIIFSSRINVYQNKKPEIL